MKNDEQLCIEAMRMWPADAQPYLEHDGAEWCTEDDHQHYVDPKTATDMFIASGLRWLLRKGRCVETAKPQTDPFGVFLMEMLDGDFAIRRDRWGSVENHPTDPDAVVVVEGPRHLVYGDTLLAAIDATIKTVQQ